MGKATVWFPNHLCSECEGAGEYDVPALEVKSVACHACLADTCEMKCGGPPPSECSKRIDVLNQGNCLSFCSPQCASAFFLSETVSMGFDSLAESLMGIRDTLDKLSAYEFQALLLRGIAGEIIDRANRKLTMMTERINRLEKSIL